MLRRIAHVVGSPITVLSSVAMLATGFWFSFSDAWWLWVDRAVYLATLLIALIVQAAQNRDTEAMQRKLDELIRAVDKADDRLQGIERQ